MKRHCITITLILCLLGSAHAFTVLDNSYEIEDYARYASTTASNRMVFDDSGNLYVNHYDGGKIMRVDSNRESSTLATGLGKTFDITWGGGTSYGNFLFVTRIEGNSSDRVWKIDLDGNVSTLANMGPPAHGPGAIAIDRTGNYSSQMYVGTTSQDKLYNISPSGSVSVFSGWPGWTDGGGVFGIDFDTTGKYGGQMYVANAFQSSDADISGLFAVAPDRTATRFCDSLVRAGSVGFDSTGLYFNNDMFVLGQNAFDAANVLWRVYADGSCEEFMTGVRSFTFGNDGAMYVSSYNWGSDEVTIARVVPEPATLLLVAAGALIARKKRS